FPCQGGRSAEPEGVPATNVERADGRGDGLLDGDDGLPSEAGTPSPLGGVPSAARLAAGGVQRIGAVARAQAGQGRTHPSLDRRVQPVNYPAPLVRYLDSSVIAAAIIGG